METQPQKMDEEQDDDEHQDEEEQFEQDQQEQEPEEFEELDERVKLKEDEKEEKEEIQEYHQPEKHDEQEDQQQLEKSYQFQSKIGSVVFPGDTFTISQALGHPQKTRISVGLTPTAHKNASFRDENILVTRAGVLQCQFSKIPKLFVANRQKRYIPNNEDRIIAIITQRTTNHYHCDINGHTKGMLGHLEFEGATKRNKPELMIGDVVYCRVLQTNKDISPQLTCKSTNFGKAWMTGESIFMKLNGGYLFQASSNWCYKLNAMHSKYLEFLGKFFPFEIAIGINGRIWIKTKTVQQTIILSNAIQNGEFMKMKDFEIMVHGLLNKFSN